MNPIEHIWDMLGRRIQVREPPVQNIRQLEAALHREWQQLSQQSIRRLTGGMRRRVEAVIQARGVTPASAVINHKQIKKNVNLMNISSQYHKASFCSKTCPFYVSTFTVKKAR
jgi:hypothetical protein